MSLLRPFIVLSEMLTKEKKLLSGHCGEQSDDTSASLRPLVLLRLQKTQTKSETWKSFIMIKYCEYFTL